MKTKILILIFITSFLGYLVSCTKDTIKPNVNATIPVDTTVVVKFSTDVYPIFANYSCTGCHGGSGGLTLSGTPSAARASLLTSNTPAVIPNSAATSPLYTYFNGASHRQKTLTATEVSNIQRWIDAGALDN